jgi:2-methylcitrate dehydratase
MHVRDIAGHAEEGPTLDRTTALLVDYALGFTERDLTDRVRTSALNHIVDTIAVGIAGTTADASRIAVELATQMTCADGATLIGGGSGFAPDHVAFANATMVRTFDWNDGMQAKGGGHPSDMIPGILAAGEIAHSTGAEVLAATTMAYEVLGSLGVCFDRKHFDQGFFMGAAVALAAGRLLGLDREALGNAVSLAITIAMPLAVHRWGELSMTKGASTAFAVRNGLFSAMLAGRGFTSAPEAIEGYFGLWTITGEFEPPLPVIPGGASVMEMSHQKPHPCESQVLGLIDLVPRIRAWTPVDEIESIELEMSERTMRHVADPPKYDPQTRETADHSLPYMLSVALVDGELTLDSYRPERYLDPALRPVMRKITVRPADDLTELREQVDGVTRMHPNRITIRTRSGAEMHEELRYHKGHFRDPMTQADIDVKFDKACAGIVSEPQRETIRKAWWGLPDAEDVAPLMHLLARFEPPTP